MLADIAAERANAPEPPPVAAEPEDPPGVAGYRQESPAIDALLRGVAAGTLPLSEYVAPTRGLVEVEDVESLATGRHHQSARLLCSAELGEWFDSHRGWLQGTFGLLDGSDDDAWASPLLDCTRERCVYSGVTEGDAWRELRFVEVDGRPVLASETRLSCCTVPDDWAAQARASADREIARLGRRRCRGR